MNRMKITQEGWAGFTGNIGQVEFVDGVSTEAWNNTFIDRVACSVAVVDADSDEPLGIQHRMIAAKSVRMEVVEEMPNPTDEEIAADLAAEAELPPVETEKFHTAEELEAIADADGIAGLRVIGAKLRVKGRAIPELIGDILKAEGAIKARLEAAKPVEPTETVETATETSTETTEV